MNKNYKIAYIALFIAVSLVFSYIESLIPINYGIPGVKLGLANVVSVISLYLFGELYTIIVLIARILLSGFLFGNLYGIIYSLAGGILSFVIMAVCKKTNVFSMIGISILGGVSHNIGQLLIAIMTVRQLRFMYYCPVLIISGLVMGTIIGIICKGVYKRVETYVRLW